MREANRGSYVNSLVLTDIASGWTEAAPLVVRESGLVVETLDRIRQGLPFALRALDVDNVLRTKASYFACNNTLGAIPREVLHPRSPRFARLPYGLPLNDEILADHNEHKIRRVTTAFTAPKKA